MAIIEPFTSNINILQFILWSAKKNQASRSFFLHRSTLFRKHKTKVTYAHAPLLLIQKIFQVLYSSLADQIDFSKVVCMQNEGREVLFKKLHICSILQIVFYVHVWILVAEQQDKYPEFSCLLTLATCLLQISLPLYTLIAGLGWQPSLLSSCWFNTAAASLPSIFPKISSHFLTPPNLPIYFY